MKFLSLTSRSAFAFALVAVAVSATTIQQSYAPQKTVLVPPMLSDGRLFTAQSATTAVHEFTAQQVKEGVILPRDSHNFFTCKNGGNLRVDHNELSSARFWVYEFVGTEPPFSGDFFISPAEIAVSPNLGSLNTLQTFKSGRRYYIMSAEDLFYSCTKGISTTAVCGNGTIEGSEQCDDGNTRNGDGCSAECTIQAVCGNGKLEGGEECDDGNTANTDGCSKKCTVETGYSCGFQLDRDIQSFCKPLIPTLPSGGSSSTSSNPASGSSSSFALCTETDKNQGVDERFVRGTSTLGNQSNTDYCESATMLIEYNCQFGFMEGLRIECENGCSAGACLPESSDDSGAVGGVGGNDERIALHNVVLASSNDITLTYSKSFETCAHIYRKPSIFNPFGTFNQGINFICEAGEQLEATINQAELNDTLQAGDIIKICHGNNGNLCSEYVEVTKYEPPQTATLTVRKDTTPLRNRQVLGGSRSEPVLRATLFADGEDIDVTTLNFTVDGDDRSIDRLELYLDGEANAFAFATRGGCAGNAFTFCASMESQQLIVPEGGDVDVLVRPRLKSDYQGGVSGDRFAVQLLSENSVAARGVRSANALGLERINFDGGSILGLLNDVVMAKIVSITNANPDANGTNVPVGITPMGQFKFTAAAHTNASDGINDVVISRLRFSVNATNVALDAASLKLYNKANPTARMNCQAYYSSGEAFTSQYISGVFEARCEGIDDQNIRSAIDSGSDETFVLEADIVDPNIASASGGTSTLQVSLTNFSNLESTNITWFDKDASTDTLFKWIEYPETTVRSTSYSS